MVLFNQVRESQCILVTNEDVFWKRHMTETEWAKFQSGDHLHVTVPSTNLNMRICLFLFFPVISEIAKVICLSFFLWQLALSG